MMKDALRDGVVAGAVMGTVLFAVIYIATKDKDRGRVDHHMDPEHNVICYTYKQDMQCFLYYDEGTHLQLEYPTP
jgi:hypothetical protein